MTQTQSTMLPLGTLAPDFAMAEVVTGKTVRRSDFKDYRAFLVMFLCAHCPYVKHIEKGLSELGRDYGSRGVSIVAICSNDAEAFPEDSPAKLKHQAETRGFYFPYLHDETQNVARAYQAACTPDFFLFDSNSRLVYRGQFDGSRPGNGVPVTGADLRAAIDALLDGRPVSAHQKPSVGCNIKWRE